MKMPPIDMIGAVISIVQVNCTSSWTCWTSLVVRVSRDGAPKRAVSAAEKPVTWWKIADRRSWPKPMRGARAEVHRADRAQHLQPGDGEHHPAEFDDGVGVALGHAVVDDRRVDRRQVQRSHVLIT